ncbi:hypothetical protein AVEN_92993-1 [Araneus ventricosus]|uniref:Uncharacterized protein n=1 Tax=Araneus ventricosus TaxID=182803 RepID=A0A4Y2SLQ7_ARAVE|nr:hypothetical protein AVEN_92993-1 [Araneus ventricosus]
MVVTEMEKVASDAKAVAEEIFMPTNLTSNRLFVLKWLRRTQKVASHILVYFGTIFKILIIGQLEIVAYCDSFLHIKFN